MCLSHVYLNEAMHNPTQYPSSLNVLQTCGCADSNAKQCIADKKSYHLLLSILLPVCTDTQTCRHTDTSTRSYTDTQTHRHADTALQTRGAVDMSYA